MNAAVFDKNVVQYFIICVKKIETK